MKVFFVTLLGCPVYGYKNQCIYYAFSFALNFFSFPAAAIAFEPSYSEETQ